MANYFDTGSNPRKAYAGMLMIGIAVISNNYERISIR